MLDSDKQVFIYDFESGVLLNKNKKIEGAFNEWEWGLIRFSDDNKSLFVCREKDSESTIITIVTMPVDPAYLTTFEITVPIKTFQIRYLKD